nr:class A beta-lactamase [Rhodococcus sp. (in: high G+C Gram-positive bacteria)]
MAVVGVAALAVSCSKDGEQTVPQQEIPEPAAPDLAVFGELEQREQARLGVYAIDLDSGATIDYRSDERFAFCSTFKVYAAGAVLVAVDSGQLALTDTRTVTAASKVAESAIDWPVDSAVTLGEFCAAALGRSDNTSGNFLIDAAGGTAAVTDFARSLGDKEFRLDRTEPELNTAIPGDDRDTTTPASLGAGYRSLLRGDVLADSSRDQLLAWMGDTRTSDMRFRAGIPAGWTSADKTGTGSYGVSNDAGLLLGPDGREILLVVLSTTTTENSDSAAMNSLVADTTREVVARA